jgi:hypothetical protein
MAFDTDGKLIKFQGKAYLEVKWRLVWFRDANKSGKIETELVSRTEDEAVFKAIVIDDNGAAATAHGSETKKDFADFMEKAETKAVGRALGYLGYGTQFAPEFEEGERIVDSPVDTVKRAEQEFGGISADTGDTDVEKLRAMTLTFGKYRGKTLGEVLNIDRQYVGWISEKGNDEAMRNAAKALLRATEAA